MTEDDRAQINLRIPRDTLRRLDEWIASLNKERRLGKATRNGLLLELLERGLEERPDLDAPRKPRVVTKRR